MGLELDQKTARYRAYDEIALFIEDIVLIPHASYQMQARARSLVDHLIDAAKEEITGARIPARDIYKEQLTAGYKKSENSQPNGSTPPETTKPRRACRD